MKQETITIPKEWVTRLLHIANCPTSFSQEYLLGYINSLENTLLDLK